MTDAPLIANSDGSSSFKFSNDSNYQPPALAAATKPKGVDSFSIDQVRGEPIFLLFFFSFFFLFSVL
jgi:hypothetical protein